MILSNSIGERQKGRKPSCPPALLPFPIYRLRGDVDLDRPRLGFLAQRQAHREDAVLVLGRHPARVDGGRQRERAAERAVAPLDVVVLLFLHFVRDLLLARDGEHEVLDIDVDVLFRHVRELGFQHELVLAGLKDVDRRHPCVVRRRETEITERIPANDGHDVLLHYLVSAYSASTTSASFTFDVALWPPPGCVCCCVCCVCL